MRLIILIIICSDRILIFEVNLQIRGIKAKHINMSYEMINGAIIWYFDNSSFTTYQENLTSL